MSSQRDSRLPMPFVVKQPYAPSLIFDRRPQSLLMPGNAAGNLPNSVIPSQNIYPCRHCDRTFSTAEGMAGHTNVHARTIGALWRRKAETDLPLVNVPNASVRIRPYLLNKKPYNLPPQTPFASSYRPVNYGPVARIPNGTMSATPFTGQVPSQFRGSSSSSFNPGLHSKLMYAPPSATFAPPCITTTTKALEVRDFLGPFAAKATPSALVILDEEDDSGLDLELKL